MALSTRISPCLLAMGVVGVSLVVYGQGPQVASPSQPLGPLGRDAPFTVAVNMSTIESAPVFVAAEGLGAGFQVVSGGVRNLANDGAHAATNAETQLLIASTANPNVRMLLTVAEGLYRVIARKSAGINTLADLRGKKITTPRNTSAHYYLVRMLASAGLQESDVTLVNAAATDMPGAVARREADAISMWEPEAQNALNVLKGDATVFQNNKLYRELFSLYTTTDVLNDPRRRRELVEFVRALIVASRKTRETPKQVIPLVARMIKQPEDTVAGSWKFHAFPAALPDDTLNLMTEEERWIAKNQSPQREPRTREQLAAMIDTSVLKDAQKPAAR
jgi:sulfonate transport system substrate-binding protein